MNKLQFYFCVRQGVPFFVDGNYNENVGDSPCRNHANATHFYQPSNEKSFYLTIHAVSDGGASRMGHNLLVLYFYVFTQTVNPDETRIPPSEVVVGAKVEKTCTFSGE